DGIADTVVVAAPESRTFDIDVKTVRSVLDAGKVVRWGRTTLRGSSCTVSIVGGEAPKAKVKREESGEKARPSPVRLDGPETVRTHVVRALLQMYGVEIDDLRVLFDDRDKELLDEAVNGRRVDIQPTNAAAASSRVGLRTYIFNGDRLVGQRTISVEVL